MTQTPNTLIIKRFLKGGGCQRKAVNGYNLHEFNGCFSSC
jgi:hypothetical protein